VSVGGVMVNVFASSVGDRRVKPKTTKIGMCCFSTKHAALRNKSKDWLAQNQVNVSECYFHEILIVAMRTEKIMCIVINKC
jgi:hypothetical protein